MPEYNPEQAKRLMRTKANLLRWYDRAHAVRTDEHCQLGSEAIEMVIAEALERAYQDGRRDGYLDERETSLRALLAQAEGIAGAMRSRTQALELELGEHRRAKRTLPHGPATE